MEDLSKTKRMMYDLYVYMNSMPDENELEHQDACDFTRMIKYCKLISDTYKDMDAEEIYDLMIKK